MKKDNRRNLLTAGAVILAVIVLFAAGYRKAAENTGIAARVNGVAVTEEELELFVNNRENAVEEALKELVPYKVIQKELADRGLAEEFSYERLMEEMEKENESRRQKKENGEVIYGPVEYTLKTYYEQRQEEYRKMWEKERKKAASEKELRALYDSHEEWFTRFGTAVFSCVAIPAGEMEKEKASGALEQIRAQMAEGKSIKEAVREASLGEYLEQRTFTGEDLSSETVTMYPEIEEQIYDLPVGQWSEMIDNAGLEWIFLYCESREGQGRQTFEESRAALEEYWEREYLDALLQKLSDEAEIEILQNKRGKGPETEEKSSGNAAALCLTENLSEEFAASKMYDTGLRDKNRFIVGGRGVTVR